MNSQVQLFPIGQGFNGLFAMGSHFEKMKASFIIGTLEYNMPP